jgi:hypothetical protein
LRPLARSALRLGGASIALAVSLAGATAWAGGDGCSEVTSAPGRAAGSAFAVVGLLAMMLRLVRLWRRRR